MFATTKEPSRPTCGHTMVEIDPLEFYTCRESDVYGFQLNRPAGQSPLVVCEEPFILQTGGADFLHCLIVFSIVLLIGYLIQEGYVKSLTLISERVRRVLVTTDIDLNPPSL